MRRLSLCSCLSISLLPSLCCSICYFIYYCFIYAGCVVFCVVYVHCGVCTAKPEALSSRAYFPRGWLLQQQYGSLLRGTLAERRLARAAASSSSSSSSNINNNNSSSSSIPSPDATNEATADSKRKGPLLLPVPGCKPSPQGQEALQQIAQEGGGLFAPVGGMKQV